MKLNNNNLTTILSIISLYCFSYSEISGKNILLTAIGIVLAIPYVLTKKVINKYYFVFFCSLIFGAISNMLIAPNGIGGVFVIIGTICLSIFIIEQPRLVLPHAFILLLYVIVFLSYKLFYLDIKPQFLYNDLSRNYPGFLLVSFNIMYLFLLYIVKLKVNLLLPFISLVISIFLYGRSSIGSLLFLNVVVLYFIVKRVSIKWAFFLIICLLIILVISMSNLEMIFDLSSFHDKGLESSRFDIWKDYFNHLGFINLFVGIDLFQVPLAAKYNGNIHNSFLNLQARTGIGLFVFFYIFGKSLSRYVKKDNAYVLLLLVIFSIRVFFDSSIFIGNLDFIYYILLFYPLYKHNKNYYAKS